MSRVETKNSIRKQKMSVTAFWIAVVIVCLFFIGTFYALFHGSLAAYVVGNTTRSSFLKGGNTPAAAYTAEPQDTFLGLENSVKGLRAGNYPGAFELVLHITKDGSLILLSSDTLDSETDAEEYFEATENRAEDYDLSEIYHLNFAENYEAADGTYPYRWLRGSDIPNDVGATTLEEALDYLTLQDDYEYLINIADTGTLGHRAVDELAEILDEYNLIDRAAVFSSDEEMLVYIDENHPELLRSAGMNEVIHFYVDFFLNRNADEEEYDYDLMIIPPSYKGMRFYSQGFVNRAHEVGIAVIYKNVNKASTLKKLTSIHADGVITEKAGLLKK